MGLSNKTVEIDFKEIFENISNYFSNLNTLQMIAWGVILLGIILIVVSFFI
jgi:flagellar biosynthesis/type III secretory pathway M-ring protein FliF/YscJ